VSGRAPDPVLADEDREALRRGAEQLNGGYFFEAHDTLEEAWSGIRGEARDFFQGLIQVAVGLYHWRNGNAGGAVTMLDRSLKRLDRYGDVYCGLDLASVRRETVDARRRVAAGEPFPEDFSGLPRYRITG
jgi:predicted metal-dependent hydrolase